jgi:translation initiation factor 6 (eIF-6)
MANGVFVVAGRKLVVLTVVAVHITTSLVVGFDAAGHTNGALVPWGPAKQG